MQNYRSADLPDEPRDPGWQPAGAGARALKVQQPFALDDQPGLPSGWIVWDRERGYRSVDEVSFEQEYARDEKHSPDVNPGQADSFGLG